MDFCPDWTMMSLKTASFHSGEFPVVETLSDIGLMKLRDFGLQDLRLDRRLTFKDPVESEDRNPDRNHIKHLCRDQNKIW